MLHLKLDEILQCRGVFPMLHHYKLSHIEIPPFAQAVAEKFSQLPQVVAVALAGSRTTVGGDESSDFDFYVYVQEEIPSDVREAIARQFSDRLEINNQFWEPGDEWIEADYGFGVDIMYRTPQWIEEQLIRVLFHHQAAVGFSTCFWWNILTSVSLYDKIGWFQQLQKKADRPYPEALQKAILIKNYPILYRTISSFHHQLESAVFRQDSISIIHRIAALLESYFDIIFAINSVPHPGEKRLVERVKRLCSKYPKNLEQQIHNITNSISSPASTEGIVESVDALIKGLDELLMREGFIFQSGKIR